jgi:hypothetical protein
MDDDRPPKREPDEDCNARRFDGDRFLGYCDRVAGWGTDHLHDGRCSSHGGSGGAPEGNQNAVGNEGGEGVPGNTNAMTHGLNMTIQRQYEAFDDDQREAFRFYVEYYRTERGLDDLVQAKRLAIAEVMTDRVEADLADDIYKTVYTESGAEMQVPKESMFDAHQQYITTIRMKQHYEGISRHPSADEDSGSVEQFLQQLPAGAGEGES